MEKEFSKNILKVVTIVCVYYSAHILNVEHNTFCLEISRVYFTANKN